MLVAVEVFGKFEYILCRWKSFCLHVLVDMACPVGGQCLALVDGARGYITTVNGFFYFRSHSLHRNLEFYAPGKSPYYLTRAHILLFFTGMFLWT